jgi:translocator protein
MKPWLALTGFIAVCLLTGVLGGQVTAQAITDWYPLISKPSWNPPAWVFAPVWTVLYILMAVAAWLVWRRNARMPRVKLALALFFVQLFLNGLWPFVFFGAHEIGLAVINIAALWVVLVATIWAFFRISRWAGTLMLPYLAWASFAAALNAEIWRLN